MTADDTSEPFPQTFDQTSLAQTFAEVLRATGVEPAAGSENRRDRRLVEPDQADDYLQKNFLN